MDLIVFGILKADPDGLCARALQAEGVDLQALARTLAGRDIASGLGVKATDAHVPFCPETKHALTLSESERMEFGGAQIDTVHQFLALIAGAESQIAKLLAPHGVDHPRQVRTRIRRLATSR